MQLDQITFTRFIAALTVVFFHYGNQVFPLNIAILEPVLKAGPIAVNYFYLLSGFIMAFAYFKPEQQASFSAKKYWLARFARIYPVYALAFLLIAVGKIHEPNFIPALVLNASLLQSWVPEYALSLNSPGWSLSVEAFFYLSFPLLLLIIYRTGLKKLALFAVIFWLATQILHTQLLNSPAYAPHNTVHQFIYYNPMMHLNAFILGIIVGVLFKQQHPLIQSLKSYSGIGLMVTSSLIILLIAFQQELSSFIGFNIALTNGQIAPLFLLFIIFLALDRSAFSRLMSHKWLVLLGEASFSLYILQRPLYGIYQRVIATRIELSETMHFYLYLTLLIIVAILSFKLFETPARKILRKITAS
ncbi:MAG: acyltransferase [Thiotrichaceae bacterium]|nr:acyltransferase [Thiotrichaceae bacterium]